MLNGRKTYVAAAMIVALGLARWLEWVDPDQAEIAFWSLIGVGMATLRHGQSTEAAKENDNGPT